MKQSKIDSLMESVVNIVIGLFVSTIANWIVLPMVLGIMPTLAQNVIISVVFTAISLARSYTIRRAFNGRALWPVIRQFPRDIWWRITT